VGIKTAAQAAIPNPNPDPNPDPDPNPNHDRRAGRYTPGYTVCTDTAPQS
jgi:hypothetical protein